MELEILVFAKLREALGRDSVLLTLPEAPTVADVLAAIAALDEQVAAMAPGLRVAVNHAFARLDQVLKRDDEVAILPPLGGG